SPLILTSSQPTSQRPLITFGLPQLMYRAIATIQCHDKPNPTLSGKAHSLPAHPFHFTTLADDAVMRFDVELYNTPAASVQRDFAMFAHRGQLREMAERARSKDGTSVANQSWYMEEDGGHYSTDTDTNTAAIADAADPIPYVPWELWGQHTTRWVDAYDAHLDSFPCSWGARGIMSFYVPTHAAEDVDADVNWCQDQWLQVYDFNPYTVRKYRSTLGGGATVEREWGGGRGGGGGLRGAMNVEVVDDWTTIDGFAFKDPVRSALPYVRHTLFPPNRADRRAEKARARARAKAGRKARGEPEIRLPWGVDGRGTLGGADETEAIVEVHIMHVASTPMYENSEE
ncbi:hypothetical protein DXG03_005465, partial [Asterophora parasitica]